jgi:hypothetical protein
MDTINCQFVIEGHQKWLPMELKIEGDKYYVVLHFDKNTQKETTLELDAALVDKPHDGLATWNYRGQIFVSQNHNK